MGDVESVENRDAGLVKYLNTILETGNRRHFKQNSILVLGYTNNGEIIPTFYASAWSVLHDNPRISRVFTGEVAVYFIQEERVEQMLPEQVCKYIRKDMEKKLEEKGLMPDLSDELNLSDD
jgi:hypothetical protein